MRGGKPARGIKIGPPGERQSLKLGDKGRIGGEGSQPLRRDILKDYPRVSGAAPRLRIDPLPQRVRLVAPGPAQVEGEFAEWFEAGREIACRQGRHSLFSVLWEHRT